MNTFTAVDFETATGYRNGCQIGLVRVENGITAKEINLSVQPPGNFYWSRFTEIHGISSKQTINAPSFDQIWQIIEPYISNQNVVAHNSFGFDFPVLEKTLDHSNLPIPNYNKICTYKIYGSKLSNLCRQHNILLNHHDELSDAKDCAELYLRSLSL
ncbi:DNA polymerase-3 subunit epsilon [Flavobacterium sp. 270]|uniref:exonuclease domain-containing protein n=1 Tax=Flavobacterium sp. 270 TaxID=2512114 RepID=UPI0010650EFA|nr:exonuclease domain-containing protein [Flavobacterium sp. 270]TDW52741.1 DNA polymerase-3 subunit epsilon [Flavobacterium sp. 270]